MNNSFIQCKKSNEEYTENLQWRKNLTIVFEKLGDKEQSSHSIQYLINQLQEMNLNQLQFYIDCILENSENFNNLGKKEVIKLLGITISFYKNKLSNYLNKIISFLVKRLTELPQSGILEITLETLGITCANITIEQKHLQKIGLNLSTIGNGTTSAITSSATSTTTTSANGLIDIYLNPIFQLFNQPTRHTQIAGILACQKVIENIYDVSNLLRPQVNKVLNQLLKKLTISTVTIQSSSSMSSFPAQYCIPHTLSTVTSLFRVLGQNYFLYHCILPSSTIDQIQNNVISNCLRTLFSNDWTARYSACSLLLTIIETLPKYYFSKRLNEILKSLNDCKYDKIKSIRDCVNKSIQLYNQINLNQNDQIIPTTPSHIEAKFKLQEQNQQQQQQQQQNLNVYNSPNKYKSPNLSSTINSPINQSPSLYSSNIRRHQLNSNNNITTTNTTTISTPSSLPPSYPSSPSLKSTIPSYSGLSSPTLKSKNYTSSLSASAISSSSSSSFSSSKTLHPSSPGFKSMPVGSYASPNSASFNVNSTSSLSTSPLIYSTTDSNNSGDRKDTRSGTTFREIFHQHQQQQIQQQHQQIQQKQQQLEYQQKQRQLLKQQQQQQQYTKQYNSIFNDNFSITNNDRENEDHLIDIPEDYNINGEDEDEYNIHINNLKNHTHNISQFDNLSISDTSNNTNNSNNTTNILTLSSLKPSPVSTPNKPSPSLNSSQQNHNTPNNINNLNNNLSASPKSNTMSQKTTTTTTKEDENETVKLLNEMMQTMNDFMIETRESIGQIKNRLTVVESSVLTLQKYYLSK